MIMGVLGTFLEIVREEIRNAKPRDIIVGIAGFVLSALFWYLLFRMR